MSIRGPQFTLSKDIESESALLDWLDNLKGSKRGYVSASIVRLLCAGMYLDKVNPYLVDMLERDLGSSDSIDSERFNQLMTLSSALLPTNIEVIGKEVPDAREVTEHTDNQVNLHCKDGDDHGNKRIDEPTHPVTGFNILSK